MSWIPLVAGILLLAGCAGMPTENYQAAKGLPRQVELEVPFYPQETYQCGPAALAMAFAYDGLSVSPSELAREVYLPGKEGTLQVEMLAAARRAGLVPYVLDNNPDAMMKELAAGHPVVVLQNLGSGFF
ncbi:MAG TPA: C39 family peptidase, partial [Burkholderiales bacterium]|nr:C39 family peptidase [Burkholderiales bacterium]